DERMVLERERQSRLERQLDWSYEVVPQVIVDLVSETENLSGIKNIFRIERAFDLAHDVKQRVAELIAHVFGAGNPDAVLGRDRTFELPDERRSLIGNQSIFSQIVGCVKIENGSNVQQAARGMTVIARFQSERFHDRLQAAHVIWKLRGANSGVLDERDWL